MAEWGERNPTKSITTLPNISLNGGEDENEDDQSDEDEKGDAQDLDVVDWVNEIWITDKHTTFDKLVID